MPLDLEYVAFVLKTLMQAVARERVENYALRIALAEAGLVSLENLDKAKGIAAKRYAKLLSLVGEDQPIQTDLMDFLRAFEGPPQ